MSETQPSLSAALATSDPWTMCGISRSQWFKLAASGRTPRPIRLGTRRPVYIIAELSAWLEAGAPDREEWERRKQKRLGGSAGRLG
jgi:predicted DNA-binding transcriptional regulator AlpA